MSCCCCRRRWSWCCCCFCRCRLRWSCCCWSCCCCCWSCLSVESWGKTEWLSCRTFDFYVALRDAASVSVSASASASASVVSDSLAHVGIETGVGVASAQRREETRLRKKIRWRRKRERGREGCSACFGEKDTVVITHIWRARELREVMRVWVRGNRRERGFVRKWKCEEKDEKDERKKVRGRESVMQKGARFEDGKWS